MKIIFQKEFFLLLCITSVLLLFGYSAFGIGFKLAFLEAEDKVPVEDESEYEWAIDNYNTTLIHPNGAGKFKSDNGNSVNLGDFQVVWWHRANANNLPAIFLENAMKDAFLSFVEKGGSLFLSQVAFHYIYDLEIESLEPRWCAPNVDHGASGIMAVNGNEKHPVFKDFKEMGVKPEEGFNIDCYGHDNMCDFYPNGPPKVVTVLAEAYQEPHPAAWFGTVSPLCEYKHGDGIIMISGWRFTVFRSGDEGCEHHDYMVKLHENIMEYLAAAAAVDSQDKLTATWGMIKK